jgi:hypothetical protein
MVVFEFYSLFYHCLHNSFLGSILFPIFLSLLQ